jgi:hypothetical protein
MKVERGKEYTTRDGRAVRIYAVDGGNLFPVHGAIKDGRGDWVTQVWSSNGAWSSGSNISNNDLIEAPRKFRLERWANVWRDDAGQEYLGRLYGSRDAAESSIRTCIGAPRIACVRVVIEGAEGDGLTPATTPENAQ